MVPRFEAEQDVTPMTNYDDLKSRILAEIEAAKDEASLETVRVGAVGAKAMGGTEALHQADAFAGAAVAEVINRLFAQRVGDTGDVSAVTELIIVGIVRQ